MYELGTMNAALAESVSQSRLYTQLLGAFAAVALLARDAWCLRGGLLRCESADTGLRDSHCARCGLAGCREPRAQTWRVTDPAGLVAGILGAVFLARVIRGLLFGIEPLDPPTLALVCLVFAAVGTIASWLPARRAARCGPIIAMRSE